MATLSDEIENGELANPKFRVTGNAKHSSIDELGFSYTARYVEEDGDKGRYFIRLRSIDEFAMANILRAQPIEVNDEANGVHASGNVDGYIAIDRIWFVAEGIFFWHVAKP